ncbi:hypothetical protein CAEBREN_12987 [Caenorhabditis brenneri]|uniref:RING-type domain-containing protein n=1 Tax=Caenorhabditis brenneri TaxID=135651 RepID=G0P5R8_CAEBE|nr:hypothetical protein CAEBREN_12987 [Caenorhabditis brenneri]
MLYLTSFYCMLHTRKVQLFDENEHKPIAGSCGHMICLECFQNRETPLCPFCQKENAFGLAVPNYTVIGLIEKRREDFWSTLKMWWSGENYGEGLCSKCGEPKTLRICLTCHGNELCEFYEGGSRLRMRSEEDLVKLACHAFCPDCFIEGHAERAHKSVKIDDIRFSKKDIRMTTAKIILKLFRDGIKKKHGLIDCKLRLERVENTGHRLFKLLSQLDYTDENECGYLGELFKMELIKKYINEIDKNLDELSNKDHGENPVCECTQLYERIAQLWNEEGLRIYGTMARGTIETFTPGCPLYFESHLEKRLKLYNIIEEGRMLYLTSLYCLLHTRKVQPFDDNEHRAIVGSCGHAICSECFQNLENPSCPLCQEENAFGQGVPNYTAIAMIEERRKDFWGALKLWWSGEVG